jgi:large subunit ribosomal protein L30
VAKLRITWIKSGIGYPRDQRRTLKALGFHRLNQVVEHEDSASIRGMLIKVNHLVKSEVVSNGK